MRGTNTIAMQRLVCRLRMRRIVPEGSRRYPSPRPPGAWLVIGVMLNATLAISAPREG